MPRGAAVIKRPGKRGVAWAIKYRDASGRQLWETLGREPEWSEVRAQRELGVRLAAVERERYRKPERVTFAEFAERWQRECLPGRNLKPSTASDYLSILSGRLLPYFGAYELAALGPEEVDGYIAEATAAGLAPNTISNHLGLLRVMFKVALRWRLVARSPMGEVQAPRPRPPELSVLNEAEIARLLAAYREAGQEAEPEEREWWALARRLVEVALGTAMRRGELLGLRWRDVELLEGRLHVREALVRGRFGSPKSRASRRMIELGPRTLGVLQEQYESSRYRSDDSLVFCHPALGSPLDPSKFSRVYMRQALRRAGISKPFRPWHDLRHTALTHEAAAGNPQAYVQAKAGHSQGSITERYIHAAQVLFPGAAARAEERMFGGSKTGSN